MLDIIMALASGGATTWNPGDKSSDIFLSPNGLQALATGSRAGVRATSPAPGKAYFEVTIDSAGNFIVGVASKAWEFASLFGYQGTNGVGYWVGGSFGLNGVATAGAVTSTTGNVIGIAIDQANHLAYFSKNGVWMSGGDPASDAGGLDYTTEDDVLPAFQALDMTVNTVQPRVTARFDPPFAYPVPAGFAPWG